MGKIVEGEGKEYGVNVNIIKMLGIVIGALIGFKTLQKSRQNHVQEPKHVLLGSTRLGKIFMAFKN